MVVSPFWIDNFQDNSTKMNSRIGFEFHEYRLFSVRSVFLLSTRGKRSEYFSFAPALQIERFSIFKMRKVYINLNCMRIIYWQGILVDKSYWNDLTRMPAHWNDCQWPLWKACTSTRIQFIGWSMIALAVEYKIRDWTSACFCHYLNFSLLFFCARICVYHARLLSRLKDLLWPFFPIHVISKHYMPMSLDNAKFELIVFTFTEQRQIKKKLTRAKKTSSEWVSARAQIC